MRSSPVLRPLVAFIPSVSSFNDLGKVLVGIFAYGFIGGFTYVFFPPPMMLFPLGLTAGFGLFLLIFNKKIFLSSIFIGEFLLTLYINDSFNLAIISAFSTTLALAIAIFLLQRLDFSPQLTQVKHIITLILIGAILEPMIKATLWGWGITLLEGNIRLLSGKIGWIFWLKDTIGVLLLVPLLLVFKFKKNDSSFLPKRRIEALICGISLCLISWVIFRDANLGHFLGKNSVQTAQYLRYLVFPFIIWTSLRFQLFETIVACWIISFLAMYGSLKGIGAFSLQNDYPDDAILLLQVFMIILISTALVLSVAITARKQVDQKLRMTLERDRLIGEIALKIRQSLNLQTILQSSVTEVKHLLAVDRAYISYLTSSKTLEILAESRQMNYPSLLGRHYPPDLLIEAERILQEPRTIVTHDIRKIQLSETLEKYAIHYHVKSSIIVPLRVNDQSLGLLVVHQCSQPRQWTELDINLLERLATQVSIALQQAQLYQQVQQLNKTLEQQVQQRTYQLEEKMAELQQFYDMKTIFLQAVSHDLKTSMMGLSMFLQSLPSNPSSDIRLSPRIVNHLMVSCDRFLILINALSEGYLNQKTPMDLNLKKVALPALLQPLLAQWQPLFEQNQVTFKYHILGDLPLIKLDPILIPKVFKNLVNNAIKHNEPGINLEIKIQPEDNFVKCVIVDNGKGLKEGQKDQIFQLYVRGLDNSRLTGVGLGCYQSRQIIEAHGGEIGVESRWGEGTQFWFTLPLNCSKIKSDF